MKSELWRGESGTEFRLQLPFLVKKCDQTVHDVPEEIPPCTVIETENCEIHIQEERITIQPKSDILIPRITRVQTSLEVILGDRESLREHFPDLYTKLEKEERTVVSYFNIWSEAS